MRQGTGRRRIGLPSPAMVVALIALGAVLGPSAVAAVKSHLAKNSVGSRQIKAQAVTSGKIANNAVTGAKVASHTLTGSDIKIGELGTVPTATNAEHATSSDNVGGHAAACPSATTLIRGVCYDDSSTGPVSSVMAAADACAAKGGRLPGPLELYATRSVLNLGSGIGDDHTYTDTLYSSPGHGEYRTIVVDGTGALSESELTTPGRYICAYSLVR